MFSNQPRIGALTFVFIAIAVNLSLWQNLAYANDGPADETEPGSTLVLRSIIKNSTWCPEKKMLVATASRPEKITIDPSRGTVYVNDVLVSSKYFRVQKKKISVCIPRTSKPDVLIFISDSSGLPIEYSNQNE